jgi:hypothetical protein
MNTIHKRILSNLGQAASLLAALILVGACAPLEKKGTRPDIPVNITFDQSHCPIGVDPDNPSVDKASNQRLAWQSVDGVGNPIDEGFDIYFDPFKGRPLSADSKGHKQSPPFDPFTPAKVQYKYTVVGERCPQKPLDPRFFLD